MIFEKLFVIIFLETGESSHLENTRDNDSNVCKNYAHTLDKIITMINSHDRGTFKVH